MEPPGHTHATATVVMAGARAPGWEREQRLPRTPLGLEVVVGGRAPWGLESPFVYFLGPGACAGINPMEQEVNAVPYREAA